MPDSSTCGCDAESCQDALVCSPATGLCEPPGSDCPAQAPTAAGETDLAFVRVRFVAGDSAEVEIENVGAGLISFQAQGYQLCNGTGNCVFLSDESSITVLLGDSFTVTIPNTVAAGGELAIIFDNEGEISSEAYVAWGTGQETDSLEAVANDPVPFWTPAQRITIAKGDTGFVCTGDTSVASGYASCHP